MRRAIFLSVLLAGLLGLSSCKNDKHLEATGPEYRITDLGLLSSVPADKLGGVFVQGERVYFTGDNKASLFCVDLETGQELWQYDLSAQTDYGFVQFARPSLEGHLFFGNSEECLVLDLSIRQLIHKTANPSSYTFVNRVDYFNNQIVAYAGGYQNAFVLRRDLVNDRTDTLYNVKGVPYKIGIAGGEYPFVYFTNTISLGFNAFQDRLEYHQIRLADTSIQLSFSLGESVELLYPRTTFLFQQPLHYVYSPETGSLQAFAEDWQYNGVPWNVSLRNSTFNKSIISLLVSSDNIFVNNGYSTTAFHKLSGEQLFAFDNQGRAIDVAVNDEILLRREGILNNSGSQDYQFYHSLFGDKLNASKMNFIIDSTLAINGLRWLAFGRSSLDAEQTQIRLIQLEEVEGE